MSSNGDEELHAEVEEDLRAQRAALEGEVERLEAVRPHRLRGVTAALAVIVAVACFAVALPGAWARRTVSNTDTFVSVVGPLASDPAVQEAMARKITDALFEALDVQQELTDVLSEQAPQLVFLAGPITESVEGFVRDQVQKLLATEEFQRFWREGLALVQRDVVAVLRGDSPYVQVVAGKVVLNYLPLVNDALRQVASTVSGLIGKPVPVPEITADTIPSEAIAKLEAALDVSLPDTFGTVVVYDSSELETVQTALKAGRAGLFGLIGLFLIAFAVALWVSPRRRRTLLQLTIAIGVITVIERRVGIASVDDVVNLAKPENQAAVRAIADALVQWFLEYTLIFLVLAWVTALVALVTGPYRWAAWFRVAVADLARNSVHVDGSVDAGVASRWVAAHRIAVMAGIGALAIAALLFLDLSAGWATITVLVAIALELVAWRVLRGSSSEPAAAT